MEWFLIGVLLGTPITDHFATREQCEGRVVVLREKGMQGRCVPLNAAYGSSGTIVPYGSGTYAIPNVSTENFTITK